MNLVRNFGKTLVKFGKGFLLIHIVLLSAILIQQSCKKSDVAVNDGAADKLLTAVRNHRVEIGSIRVKSADPGFQSELHGVASARSGMRSGLSGTPTEWNGSNQNEQLVYIDFADAPVNPDYTYDINGMASLVANYQGVITYQPSSNSYSFTVPLNQVQQTLNPLIVEARAYLHARGLTDPEIDQMIIDEGGQEVDLVPFATTLAEYEKSGTGFTGMNYMSIFGNAAYAGDVGHCAMVALGVDALWALGGSNASSWSKAAIKKAFGAVAKRFLGPVGVAIAVTSFALCLGDWLP